MHVQFFPVYVLTCGAHNTKPLLSFERLTASGSLKLPLRSRNIMCPLPGLGLLGSLCQIPLLLDPRSLQGVYLGYLNLFGYA